MQKGFEDLYDFVDRAVKSRKYPKSTGVALKTALNLFEKELNDEERNSIDEFEKNLDHVYQGVFSKNKNFSASSLATYRSRVVKVLSDYAKYGTDPTKMASWSPKVITRVRSGKKASAEQTQPLIEENKSARFENFDRSSYNFDFIGGVKLLIPKTQRTTEAIMDGELKEIKMGLKKFTENFCIESAGDDVEKIEV